jgi:UDP-2-acetamido-3-amino-2,3-dideoxy-glucuronate N-acetyltransferase
MERHSTAIVESHDIGPNTRIAANAHILAGAKIGKNCEIGEGAIIGSNVILEDEVTVGPCAVFCRNTTSTGGSQTIVHSGASIGANSTILDGVKIGHKSSIGAGSVVSQNIPQNAIVIGNPAQITGYVNSPQHNLSAVTKLEGVPGEVYRSKVSGVSVLRLPTVPDLRGRLSFGEFDNHIPFAAKRFFLIYDVPSKELRGEHAHLINHQFLICIQGSVNALVDDGNEREEFVLDSPNIGIHIPPLVWGTQYKYSPGSMLLVFASHVYRAEDYIRDYQEFITAVKK